jgi:radical SAM superfamily enzyme YgiQ (UPF0313 family)
MNKILLVNPPSMTIKPQEGSGFKGFFAALKGQHPPINTGLLSIASDIAAYNPNVEVVDGVSQDDYMERISSSIEDGVDIVGVGVPSAYEYLEALEIAEHVKQTDPEVKVIFGGTHIAPMGKLVFEHTPNVDAVGLSEGESIFREYNQGKPLNEINGVITRDNLIGLPARRIKLDDLGPLRLDMFPNFRSYTPYVEDSRGCQHHCMYCTNDVVMDGQIVIRGVKSFAQDLEHAVELYGEEETYAILASNFGVNVKNTLEKAKVMKSLGIKWMTELRMDSRWEEYLDALYESGMRIVTSGMESANPDMLKSMNKTRDPKKYVERASSLVRAVQQYPDLVFKISYMIYPGETRETLQETLDFINEHRDGIDSVLLTPTFVVEGTKLMKQLKDPAFVEMTGYRMIPDSHWNSRGVHFGDLSHEIDYERAIELRERVEEEFSNDRAMQIYEASHTSRMQQEGTTNLWRERF